MKIFLRPHSLGIPARLTMLAVVTALPLVAVGSFAILRTVDDQRAQIQNDVKQMVESFLADVDREISAVWDELQVLATSPSLQSGNFLEFDQQMRAALKIRGTSIVLHDTHAQQLLSTNRPFGEPLPRATNSEMHDRVVATGKPQISDLIMGAVLKRPILTVGVPMPTGTDCPSLPQVQVPSDSLKSFPTMVTCRSTSGPLPIKFTPLRGAVSLPSSMR